MIFKSPRNQNSQESFGPLADFLLASVEEIVTKFGTALHGLSDQEAKDRLEKFGFNELPRKKKRTILFQILSKFLNPLVVVLSIIAIFSFFFGEKISAALVIVMALISVALSFIQEYRAGKEAEKLSEMVRATAVVIRNGRRKDLPIREIVPGDVVDLYAGDIIPADLRIISCKDLFLNQAAFTGESFPIEKSPLPLDKSQKSFSAMANIAFMGSSVESGTGLGVAVKTGLSTQFGAISRELAAITPASSFDKGIRQFTWLMIRAMLVMIVLIFAINVWLKGNWTEAFLFSLAVAVGLTPEMMPMLVAINLSKGAIAMSKKQVIVKRLNAIQNFGAMDVLCTDKTGTLTLDRIVLERHCDVVAQENDEVLRLAYLNSYFQTGLKNLLDKAILVHEDHAIEAYQKIDEIPFDFARKIMSVVIASAEKRMLVAKGAPEEIFKKCTHYELEGETLELEPLILTDLKEEYDKLSTEGFRVLAIAYKETPKGQDVYSKNDEQELTLKGYLAFLDPPKPTAKKTIDSLQKLGIEFKVLTGDNDLVTKKICADVGINVTGLMTGEEIEKLDDVTLRNLVRNVSVFARLSPLQKERVIRALHANQRIVGYLGDGINDAPALKAADVGISVNNAVDIARESADIILLRKNLLVLRDGVLEGRRTFGNIVKYIKMGASSNFGNMISMTGASLFLPFLPMLPVQILLNNFLYDLSQIAIPSDEVDEDYLATSRPWDINNIKKFMLCFGPISSVFDFLTFGILFYLFHASADFFRTGWFLESFITQTLVIHVIRTAKVPFLQSRPSPFLIFTSIYLVTICLFIPYTPLGGYFGFVIPDGRYLLTLIGVVAIYLLIVQKVKSWFVVRFGYA
jgi:P-type Mg2+ transporter